MRYLLKAYLAAFLLVVGCADNPDEDNGQQTAGTDGSAATAGAGGSSGSGGSGGSNAGTGGDGGAGGSDAGSGGSGAGGTNVGSGNGGSGGSDAGAGGDGGAGAAGSGTSEPRLIALSREGRVASLDMTSPWQVRASLDLKKNIRNARCNAALCAVTHPEDDSVSFFTADKLEAKATVSLDPKSQPYDVAFVDEHTAVVSQYNQASLVRIDLTTYEKSTIDISALADSDGLPEATRMAVCGRRVYVQLGRTDHESTAPSAGPAVLGVVDFDAPAGPALIDVDSSTEGIQGITLADRPEFDMPSDCASGMLYVAEPRPLFKGGGSYEKVDLATNKASEYPVSIGAQVGGFAVLTPETYWLITHTDTGPGPSSHLTFSGGGPAYNTFAYEHVNDLALDKETDQLFYPDPCGTVASTSCKSSVRVFTASVGGEKGAIDVGFHPIEVTLSR